MGAALLIFLVFFPIAMGVAAFPLGRRDKDLRDWFVIAVTGVELAAAGALLLFQGTEAALAEVCGFGLHFQASAFGTLLAIIAAFLWLMTALPSREYFLHAESRNRYYMFYLMTLGALMGVFLSADLYTTFVFFEIMSFTSYVWVVQNETPQAIRAAETYLAVAVIGGLTLLMGLFLLWSLLGTLRLDALYDAAAALPEEKRGLLWAAGLCCLVGFGAKAGMFPLHIWLPKAHPVAPAPASALLSGILTKSGVFGILAVSRLLFPVNVDWSRLVLVLGVVTMLGGAILAVFSIDLKQTLACSSMSQIGFILVGVAMQGLLGEENALAAWGTVLHMMNHSLIKLVLFVAAGVVYLGCHSLDLNEVRGFAGNDKPWLGTVFVVGAASIAGVPGFSGYVSKTLLHESIVEYIHHLEAIGAEATYYRLVEVLFLFAGGLTAAYMTKLCVCLCLDPKKPGHHVPPDPYMNRKTMMSLTIGAAALLVFGLRPEGTMEPIAHFAAETLGAGTHEGVIHYFAWVNLKGALISLAIGAVVYLVFIRRFLMAKDYSGQPVYLDRWPDWADLEDRIYRPVLSALAFWGAAFARTLASVGDAVIRVFRDALHFRAPGVIRPKGDDAFGVYGNDPERNVVTETFAFDLLMAGIGILAVMVYLLL